PEDRAGHCRRDPERRTLPEHLAVLVDHACCVDHGPDLEAVLESTGDPERHEPSLARNAARGANPDRARRTEPPRAPLLNAHRAGKNHPVRVQAMLRTPSLRLSAATSAADGSKPEWIPQCSQRGSLPGPYSSHSIPSRRASYVGKMPSVSR